jgi:hypothetical protein
MARAGGFVRAGDRSLVQGLKGDATYLVVNEKSELENYGINGARARCAPAGTCLHMHCLRMRGQGASAAHA